MEAVRGQPIKKNNCFRILQSLSWRPPADQKPRGLWVRDWGTGILLPQDFCGETMEAITGQLTKKPEDSGYEIVYDPCIRFSEPQKKFRA